MDAILFHRQRPVHVVQLVVQPARIAHRLTPVVPAPQRRRRRLTVGTGYARPAVPGYRCFGCLFGFLAPIRWPVGSRILAVVQGTSVAQGVTDVVPSP